MYPAWIFLWLPLACGRKFSASCHNLEGAASSDPGHHPALTSFHQLQAPGTAVHSEVFPTRGLFSWLYSLSTILLPGSSHDASFSFCSPSDIFSSPTQHLFGPLPYVCKHCLLPLWHITHWFQCTHLSNMHLSHLVVKFHDLRDVFVQFSAVCLVPSTLSSSQVGINTYLSHTKVTDYFNRVLWKGATCVLVQEASFHCALSMSSISPEDFFPYQACSRKYLVISTKNNHRAFGLISCLLLDSKLDVLLLC